MNSKKILTSLIFVYLVVPYLLVLLVASGDVGVLVRFFPDDAFYYLQVAYNLSHSGIVSFDGVNITTGFHPLQLLLASSVLFFLNKNAALVFFFLFNAFALSVSFSLIFKALSVNRKTVLLSALLTLPIFNLYLYTSSGLESALLLIAISVLYFQLIKIISFENITIYSASALGATFGIVVLCRLDMVIPVSLLVAYLSYQLIKRCHYKEFVVAATVFFLTLVPYFLWIYNVQGTFFPISAIAKYDRERWRLDLVLKALTGGSLSGLIFIFSPILVAMYVVFVGIRNRLNSKYQLMAVSAMSSLAYIGYILFVSHEPFRWYLNFCFFISVILLVWIFDINKKLLDRLPLKFSYSLPIICFVLNIGVMYYWSGLETTSYWLLKMTRSIDAIVPSTASIATNDAGVVGYFSHSKVHNLDGLVNSYDNWNQFLKQRDYVGYAQKYGIDYILLRNEILNDWVLSMDASQDAARLSTIETFNIPRFGEQTLVKIKK